MMRPSTTAVGLLALALQIATCHANDPKPAASSGLPAPMVYLRDVDPSILQDMRYASANNFTGRRVPGYDAAECILTSEAAAALSLVQADLKAQDLSLKMHDCYRPRRAVRFFVRWVEGATAESGAVARQYYPSVRREDLIKLGYIAQVSTHSRGDTVDLTLVSLKASGATARHVPCNGPAKARRSETLVDMGTDFDCFDPKSQTASGDITPAQKRWRDTLVTAMAKRGFKNYRLEWWHFTFGGGGGPSYDFPITARPRS